MWSNLIAGTFATLIVTWIFAFTIENRVARAALSFLIPSLVVAACAVFAHSLIPSARLALGGLTLLFAMKGASLLRLDRRMIQTSNRIGLFLYSSVWPGIDAHPFHADPRPVIEDGRRFGQGMICFITGALGFFVLAYYSPHLSPNLTGGIAIALMLLAVHLGISNMLTEFVRALGWPGPVLFDRPWRAHSLANFWSTRWNRPFVEMNRIFFLPWFSRRLGIRVAIFLVFLISGALHELAISYPVGAGWGGPMVYFAIQGAMTLVERRLRIRGPFWVALVVLLPTPLLFHAAFREGLILPLVNWVHQIIVSIPVTQAFSTLITLLGVAQFLVLFASFQVPTRLRWREELPRLSSLNQKLMWTYGSFIVFTIVAWGILTLTLRDDLLSGSRPGIAIATVIFCFWGLRLVTDMFYFRSSDWPQARFLPIGHALLNSLFTAIFLGYGAILGWHWFCHGGVSP